MASEANWLRFLEPSVRPTGTPAPRVQPRITVEGRSFGELLAAAGRSPMPDAVAVADEARDEMDRLGVELTDATRRAIGEAVDRADARGARRTLLLLDGAALTADVAERRIVAATGGKTGEREVLTGIDSATWVQPVDETTIDRMMFR